MSQITVSRPPGRPKDEAKREAIIDAARHMFNADNYDSVTMEQVAAAAGVAKMTVYSHFRDKESLFEAIVRATSDMLISALPALPGDGGDLEEELVQFGRVFLHALLNLGVVNSMYRHFDMLSRNYPLAERFYHAGPGRTRATLAAYLVKSAAGRPLSHDEGLEAASDLMSLWLGDLPQQIMLGLVAPLSNDEMAQRVRRCARLFIRAYDLPKHYR